MDHEEVVAELIKPKKQKSKKVEPVKSSKVQIRVSEHTRQELDIASNVLKVSIDEIVNLGLNSLSEQNVILKNILREFRKIKV